MDCGLVFVIIIIKQLTHIVKGDDLNPSVVKKIQTRRNEIFRTFYLKLL